MMFDKLLLNRIKQLEYKNEKLEEKVKNQENMLGTYRVDNNLKDNVIDCLKLKLENAKKLEVPNHKIETSK